MAIPVDVKPYELTGLIIGDSYLTHYKAKNDKGDEFVITEFNPTYMTQRGDDNSTLDVSERFTKEYVKERDEFIRRATAFEEIRDSSLHAVVETFERNNTAYLVRKACVLTPVETYMGGQQMDYTEAYYFIRPLLTSMAQAAEQGIVFSFGIGDLRVNSHKQLVLTGLMSWDTDFHPPLIEIVRLFYRLVTGVEAAAQGAPGFSVFGVEIPPRLETMLMEVLSGDILYGSLDDFYRKFKSLIDGSTESDTGASVRLLKILRSAVAVLAVLFVFSLSGLVFGAVEAFRSNYTWTNPERFADREIPQRNYNFTNIAQVHPRNISDPLDGSFIVHDGFLFSRTHGGVIRRRVEGMMVIPGATGVVAAADDVVILYGALPSSMAGHERHLYFSDTANNNFMFRSIVNGTELEQITDYPVLHMAVIGHYLYYTRPDDNYHMHRMDVRTLETVPFLQMQAINTTSHGNKLYFLSDIGTDHSGLYVLDTETGRVEGIIGGVGLGFRKANDALYYLDAWGRIRSISPDGTNMMVYPMENVVTFDVFANWIVFTEEGRHMPRAFNKTNNRFFTLSNTEWVSYLWVHDAVIYGIDHRDPHLVHSFDLP